MKNLFLIAILALMIGCSGSTNNEESKYKEAIITGVDMRKCLCCGGWFIKIDSVEYNFATIPEGAEVNLNTESLPLTVLIQYNLRTEGCTNIIDITRMKKK